MRKFAWITFLTGLALSGVAGFYSVVGLAMIFSGAYWPVIVLASMLEVSKLVAVSWMYRYRHLAGYLLRTYFFLAVFVLMSVTSMGIFGYLTRAHVESEAGYTTAQLTLDEINQREQALQGQRTTLNTELTALTTQSNTLITGLSNAQKLTTTNGAVTVQRQISTQRAKILDELQKVNAQIGAVQKERIAATTETNKTTADIGPLRYVAQAIYGNDEIATVRKAVVWLTGILMVVFDPMAIMLLIAANILFTRLNAPTPTSDILDLPMMESPRPITTTPAAAGDPVVEPLRSTDVPSHLIRQS